MPVLALPAIIGGVAAPDGLIQTAYVGSIGFVAVAVLAAAAFGWDAPLVIVGRGGALADPALPARRGPPTCPST